MAFPSELSNSSSLVSIYASNANIKGEIPDFFDTLRGLQDLRLSYNGSAIQKLWLNNQKSGLFGTIDVVSGMTALTQDCVEREFREWEC